MQKNTEIKIAFCVSLQILRNIVRSYICKILNNRKICQEKN